MKDWFWPLCLQFQYIRWSVDLLTLWPIWFWEGDSLYIYKCCKCRISHQGHSTRNICQIHGSTERTHQKHLLIRQTWFLRFSIKYLQKWLWKMDYIIKKIKKLETALNKHTDHQYSHRINAHWHICKYCITPPDTSQRFVTKAPEFLHILVFQVKMHKFK